MHSLLRALPKLSLKKPTGDSSDPLQESYLYDELEDASQQIRLLFIGPNTDPRAPLCLTLKSVWLRDDPVFDAISYRWGDDGNEADSDDVDGSHSPTRREFATPNLLTGIKCLRSKGVHVLWADGLCINQSDRKEKAKQVTIMGAIYSKARRVHIWLGNLPSRFTRLLTPGWKIEDYPEATDIVEAAQRELQAGFGSRHPKPSPASPPPSQATMYGPAAEQTNAVSELLHTMRLVRLDTCLYRLPSCRSVPGQEEYRLRLEYYVGMACFQWLQSRSYWSRIWILQEILLAKREPIVHAGIEFEVGLSTFATLAVRIIYQADGHEDCCVTYKRFALGFSVDQSAAVFATYIFATYVTSQRSTTHLPWNDLYIIAMGRHATDPRDHVYGLIGLMHQPDVRYFPVDYSWDVSKVYRHATVAWYLSNHRDQNLLFTAAGLAARNCRHEIPSWSLAWDNDLGPQDAVTMWEPSQASGSYLETNLGVSQDASTLTVNVTYIDRISATDDGRSSEDAEFAATRQTYINGLATHQVRQWYHRYMSGRALISREQSFAFARTALFDGRSYDTAGHDDHEHDNPEFHEMISSRMRSILSGDGGLDAMGDGGFGDICLFKTFTGVFGKTRIGVRNGDRVCIMKGCPWPVVLRPVSAPDIRIPCLQLISICYLHGHMYGKGLNDSLQWTQVALV